MVKKICCPTLLILALLLASVPQLQAQTVFKMAFGAPSQVYGPLADKFGELVAKKTGNQVQIKWFGGGQLGSNTQNFAQIKTGQIDMILLGSGLLSIPKGAEDFNILSAPYVFRDQDHFRKFFSSAIFKNLIEKAEKEGGFKFMGYLGDRAPRQLTTTRRRVMKLEDVKGLTIRFPDSKPIFEVWKAWGATPVRVSGAELYIALKQGVIEAQENGFDSIVEAKLYEVQKYAVILDYVRVGVFVLLNSDQWNKLTPAQKMAFEEAAHEAEQIGTRMSNDAVDASVNILKKNGVEITTPDLAAFKKGAAEVLEKLDGDVWQKGLYQTVQSIR